VHTLRALGRTTTVINCNPETVSTDYDICDRLYFEELSLERVLDILELERPQGVAVSFGGQTPNNLVMALHGQGAPILGTHPEMIDAAEDRSKFSALLDRIQIDQPAWASATSIEQARAFASHAGYPVIVRPSYVLSGAAMRIVAREEELERCLHEAARVSSEYPVVVSKFVERAKEIEIDAVAKDGEVLAYALSEHVEYAGVHSGDATLVLPAQRLWLETVRKIKRATRAIAKELRVSGPFNIQYLAKDNEIKVIECNLRCSRTFPFVSKVLGVNFVELATRVLLGMDVEPVDKSVFELDHVGVKAPNFSFTRLQGADPVLGVEMVSTGEVASIGEHAEDAFLQAMLASGVTLPRTSVFLSTGPLKDKLEFLGSARALSSMGFSLYGTHGTAAFLAKNDVRCEALNWPDVPEEPNVLTYLREKRIELVVNIPKSLEQDEIQNDYTIRRTAVDFGIPLITNLNCAILFVRALEHARKEPHEPKSWQEFVKMKK
jgi:carbamoyl-phosphate synthase large subunit